jgi:hypothetical protein
MSEIDFPFVVGVVIGIALSVSFWALMNHDSDL